MEINRETMNASEFAYASLKEKILKLELLPGQKISEKSMSEALNVSRTPVREAFLKLKQLELVDIFSQSGTFVSQIDLEHVHEAGFVRKNIETSIIKIACENFSEDSVITLHGNLSMQELYAAKDNKYKFFELDEAFHKEIYYGCKKWRTWNMIQQMNTNYNRFRLLRLSLTEKLQWDVILSQHKAIYSAIINKDSKLAVEFLDKHLNLMETESDILKKEYPSYFKN